MMERFRRGDASEEPRTTGSVATSTQREREAEVADERTMTGDRPMTDQPVTDDDRTVARDRDGDGVADDNTITRDRDGDGVADDRTLAHRHSTDRPVREGVATTAALETARARQRDEYGGINWGAAFFGWLVAIGVAALLTAILAAAGAAVGLYDTSQSDAVNATEEIGVGGGIALLVVLMIAYYAGGYVAGRMSRFDGGRQGLGTWIIGLVVTLLLAGAAVVLGDQYNVLEQLNLPSLPVGDSTLATGGIIALVAIVLGSILAAMSGGKMGERYHRRVDRAGFID